MTVYLAEGAAYTVELDGRIVTLRQLQDLVDGSIELVPGSRAVTGGGCAFCNNDGRRRGLLPNPLASLRFRIALVGDVVELTADELDGMERAYTVGV